MALTYRLVLLQLVVLMTSLGSVLNAQQIQYYNGDYTILDSIEGTAIYAFYQIDEDSIQYQGRFDFRSHLILKDRSMDIEKVVINGMFRRGLKRGTWEYEQSAYNVRFDEIKGLDLKTSLNGEQFKVIARYDNGMPIGRWETQRVKVKDSKPQGRSVNSSLQFKEGLANGPFNYAYAIGGVDVSATGRFSEDGFMDGKWRLLYLNPDDVLVEETRLYQNGFLTDLLRINKATKDTLNEVSYVDVKDRLVALKVTPNEVNYRKGDKGFGLLFDNGYRKADVRRYAQVQGNDFLREVFGVYDVKHSIIGAISEPMPPVINFTRRFQFIYPETDDSIIAVLEPKLKQMADTMGSLIDNATFQLNKTTTDSLAKAYVLFQHAQNKVELVQNVINRIENGDFDFLYRDIYYEDGVPGLRDPDTLKYTINKREKTLVVEMVNAVTSPDDLLLNLQKYTDELNQMYLSWYNGIRGKLESLQKEEVVMEMDKAIVELSQKLTKRYSEVPQDSLIMAPSDLEFVMLDPNQGLSPLQREMFSVFTEEKRASLISDYAGESSYDRKIEHGEKIIGILRALIDVYPMLSEIDRMPKSLDSSFTRYTENPFFYRPMESKFLTNIYTKGVERLLPHMVNELKRFRTGEDIRTQVDEILALRKRLEELANSPDDDGDVKRLDRRMRRENVPDRIKRLLGL